MSSSAKKKARVLCSLRGLSSDEVSRLRAEYEASKPYKHVVVREACVNLNLAKVEVLNLKAIFKETDLFKVYQVPEDLRTVSAAPQLASLREALSSLEFRNFVQKVTGCGPLSERIDCSANVYDQGGHLLCHDDVIGSRAVSYILYLVEEDWGPADGGALELYGFREEDGAPKNEPEAKLLPQWNSLLLFQVHDKSFHSIEEVTSRPRLTVSGWFHHHSESGDGENERVQGQGQGQGSTLSEQKKGEDADVGDFFLQEEVDLSDFVSEEYLKEGALTKICDHFCSTSAVRLANFLKPDVLKEIKEGDVLEGPVVGPPHKRRYVARKNARLERLVKSNSFRDFLTRATSLRLTTRGRLTQRRFRPGLDYTVASPLAEPPRLDATLAFFPVEEALPRENTGLESGDLGGFEERPENTGWESGDLGGFETYVELQDDDGQRDDVYQRDDDDDDESELLSVPAVDNVLSLVLRDPGTMRFVKYVSKRAPGPRDDLELVLEIHPDDLPSTDLEGEDDDGDDDDDDQED